jgi:hypothetical protein
METPLPDTPAKETPLIPLLLFLSTFGVYLRTLCPTFNVNDSAETILACHTLSLQHPPGYPLFTLWGRLADLLPLGQPMFRISLASSLLASFCVVLLYGALIRWNAFPNPLNRFFALAATLCFAFSFPFWFQAGGAKGGLYVLNALVTIAVLFLLLNPENQARPSRTLSLIFFLLGLGLANHWPSQIVTIPAYAILARPILKNLASAKWVQAASFLFIGLSAYLYLPLRACLKPILNWWNPQTVDYFTNMILRSSYDTMGATWSGEVLVLNLVRLAKKLNVFDGFIFTWAVLFLALAGFFFLRRRSKDAFLGLLFLALGAPLSVVLFSKSVEGYEWMIDPFFTPAILALCILAGLAGTGLAAGLMERKASLFSGRKALKGLLFFPALLPLVLNFHAADQSRYTCSYQYGLNELKTVIPGSLIICSGDIDLMPFYYVKDVQGRRPDVAFFSAWIIQFHWYREAVFRRWPDLEIPALIPDSQTIVQDLVKYKANQRPLYFTNIFTPMWLLHPENTIPEGFLWRIKTSKGLNFADDTQNVNRLWGSYRMGGLDSSQGYWDDPTTILKDSYGFALELSGSYYYRHVKKLPLSAWFYKKAMEYRIPNARGALEKQLKEVTLP